MIAINSKVLEALLEKYGDLEVHSMKELNELLIKLSRKEGYKVKVISNR